MYSAVQYNPKFRGNNTIETKSRCHAETKSETVISYSQYQPSVIVKNNWNEKFSFFGEGP